MKVIFVLLIIFVFGIKGVAQVQEVKTEFAEGREVNGKRVGDWKFYDKPNELSLVFNYDSGKVIYLKKDTSNFLIKKGDVWVESKLVSPPHVIGSSVESFRQFVLRVKYPRDARVNNIEGLAAVSFVIDEKGNVGEFEILKELEYGCSEEVLRVLQKYLGIYIPGKTSTGPVAAKMIFVFRFGLGKTYEPSIKDMKKHPELLDEASYIINFYVTAYHSKLPK